VLANRGVNGELVQRMTQENLSELDVLRRRAYGPHPDIHLDSHALDRLRELEGGSRRPTESNTSEDPLVASAESRTLEATSEEAQSSSLATQPPSPEDRWRLARQLLALLVRARRRDALIVLGCLTAVILGVIALVVVDRVQTDPLQVGAEQVARLSIDTSYDMPQFFATTAEGARTEAFQEFYGLRTVMTDGGGVPFSANSGQCIVIFDEAAMEPDSDSFSGMLLWGCAAGGFPAVTQFDIGSDEAPDELRDAFPDSAAFQFVLDADNSELVIFLTE
jgi:hypothetical protein